MENKVKVNIEEILTSVKQMVISTCKDDNPWSATVLFAFDKNLTLYFFSGEDRRHSKEIAKNANVSGAIAREHTKGLEESSHRGVQFEGICKLVASAEVENAYELVRKRFPQIVKYHTLEDAPKELYKIKVKKFVLFDTLNFSDEPRQELKMSETDKSVSN